MKADLLEEGSFHNAFKNCDGVFHTASPVILTAVENPEVELIQPALKGTLNVLKAAKDEGVKKVVFTSSMAAVRFYKGWDFNVPLDEENWSDEKFCRENNVGIC